MRLYPRVLTILGVALAIAITSPPLWAGTQDFVLVNDTGFDIEEIYISETTNDDWEEDVLGRDILEDGERLKIRFKGRSACRWDLMAVDEDESEVTWSAIDLCSVSLVVLMCDKRGDECWAEFE